MSQERTEGTEILDEERYEFTQEEIERGMATLENWLVQHPRPRKKAVFAGNAKDCWAPVEIVEELRSRIKKGTLGQTLDVPELILQSAAKSKG
jgi:hypothetical protein